MAIKNIPSDINAEILLQYFAEGTYDVEFKGLHKRNSYGDILDVQEYGQRVHISLGRNSLYNSLPEYLFHNIDRFDSVQSKKKDTFKEEYLKEEQEKEYACKFFAPLDLSLLQIKLDVRKVTNRHTGENKILIGILSDSLSQEQLNNRFIRKTLQYLPMCKYIRGSRTQLTLMLRKILMDENVVINITTENRLYEDNQPRYCNHLDSELGDTYIGNQYMQDTLTYSIEYWNDDECNENFLEFIKDVEEYRTFVQDYFLSVETQLVFHIQTDAPSLRLSDTTTYNYLNFNTNI